VVNKINLLHKPLLRYQYFNDSIKNKKWHFFDFEITTCKTTRKQQKEGQFTTPVPVEPILFHLILYGPVSGNVLLRREQYRKADDMTFSAQMAKSVLTGKLANCRTVLQRALRDHSDKLDELCIKARLPVL
jgi:CRISPR/Cas system-associated endonuclease Cas1